MAKERKGNLDKTIGATKSNKQEEKHKKIEVCPNQHLRWDKGHVARDIERGRCSSDETSLQG